MGKVYLVGAGPGDAGLITMKGLALLKKCDALVYDRLASEELLDQVRQDCVRQYVGKEPGKHYRRQEEINALLVDMAKHYDVVVRLKGGDPFVFGRGGEEIEALEKENLPYEVVPGVTSAVAVPEAAGIPVTHRGISRSFHVITGHTQNAEGSPDCDYETLAKLEGTLVFLMGLGNLEKIVSGLVRAGKNKATPAAVISNGTLATQEILRGTLETIAEQVKQSSLVSPAVIVIGETAGYQYLDRKASQQGGARVGVTATPALWKKLKHGLEEMGMQPVQVCRMDIEETKHTEELKKELHHLKDYQWVIFTSQNAVQLFWEKLRQEAIDLRSLSSLHFAVLGSGTAEKLREYGIKADFIPTVYSGAVLGEELVGSLKPGERVLLPRACQGSKELTDILARQKILCREIPVYDVKGRLTGRAEELEKLDYLVFASASGVTAFFTRLRQKGRKIPEHMKIACIGEMTKQRLEQEYGPADVVATVNNVSGLLNAIREKERESNAAWQKV